MFYSISVADPAPILKLKRTSSLLIIIFLNKQIVKWWHTTQKVACGDCDWWRSNLNKTKSYDEIPGLNQFDLRLLSFSRDFVSWRYVSEREEPRLLQLVVSLSPMMLHLFVMVSCKNLVRPVIVIVRLKIPLLLREYKVCCCRQEFPFPSIYLVLLSLLANQTEAETICQLTLFQEL